MPPLTRIDRYNSRQKRRGVIGAGLKTMNRRGGALLSAREIDRERVHSLVSAWVSK